MDTGDSMDTIDLPAAWIEQGTLPKICPRHGLPATDQQRQSFYARLPRWLVVSIFLTLALAIILVLIVRRSVTGYVPRCDRCRADRRRAIAIAAALWVVLVASIGPIAALGNGVVVAVWFVILVAAVIVSVRAPHSWSIDGWFLAESRSVRLVGVDPAFVEAARTALAAT